MSSKKAASSSKPREVAIRWTNDMNRKFFELYVREMNNNNPNSRNISRMSKDKIVADFNAAMAMNLDWIKFKNRYDHVKKFYDLYRRLLTRTGVTTDPVTKEIIMDNSWWKERIEENHEFSRLKGSPLKDIDLLDQIFGNSYILPTEGWNPGKGPDIIQDKDEDRQAQTQNYEFEDPTRVADPTLSLDPMSDSAGGSSSTSTRGGSLLERERAELVVGHQRKRTAFERMWTSIADSYRERTEVIKKQYEETTNQQHAPGLREAIKILDCMNDIIPHSKLYWESIKLLESNNIARDVFLGLERKESRIQYLEMKTGVDRRRGLG